MKQILSSLLLFTISVLLSVVRLQARPLYSPDVIQKQVLVYRTLAAKSEDELRAAARAANRRLDDISGWGSERARRLALKATAEERLDSLVRALQAGLKPLPADSRTLARRLEGKLDHPGVSAVEAALGCLSLDEMRRVMTLTPEGQHLLEKYADSNHGVEFIAFDLTDRLKASTGGLALQMRILQELARGTRAWPAAPIAPAGTRPLWTKPPHLPAGPMSFDALETAMARFGDSELADVCLYLGTRTDLLRRCTPYDLIEWTRSNSSAAALEAALRAASTP